MPPPKRITSELAVQTHTVSALQQLGAKVIKIHVDGYTEEGTPDLVGSFEGQAFALEMKKENEYPSAKQDYEMRRWRRAGAVSVPCWSVNDALTALGVGIDKGMSPWYNLWRLDGNEDAPSYD